MIVEREGLAHQKQFLERIDHVAIHFFDVTAAATNRVMVMFVVRAEQIPELTARCGPA